MKMDKIGAASFTTVHAEVRLNSYATPNTIMQSETGESYFPSTCMPFMNSLYV